VSVVEISAVIPVYNDRESLEKALPASIAALEAITPSFEIIVAEDGSTDGSAECVLSWEENDSRVQLFHSDERLGRGMALNRAFAHAKAPVVCYYDVDLATDMAHLPELVGKIRDGCDVATGSRLMPASDIVRTAGREVVSRGYNKLVRMILRSRLYDHQCGFKAFNRERLLTLLPQVQDNHWFWDTEVLILAQRAGYRVCEFPVVWRTGQGTTVKTQDVTSMGTDIFRLWWRLHGQYKED